MAKKLELKLGIVGDAASGKEGTSKNLRRILVAKGIDAGEVDKGAWARFCAYYLHDVLQVDIYNHKHVEKGLKTLRYQNVFFDTRYFGGRILLNGCDVTGLLHTPKQDKLTPIVAGYEITQWLIDKKLTSTIREMDRRGGVGIVTGRDFNAGRKPDYIVFLQADAELCALLRSQEYGTQMTKEQVALALAERNEKDARNGQCNGRGSTSVNDTIDMRVIRLTKDTVPVAKTIHEALIKSETRKRIY